MALGQQKYRSKTTAEYLELRPPLKWAGGKRWLVPVLKEMWKGHEGKRLVEPFCGGLSVALGFRPEMALLNDNNEHLVNFYIWLQQGLEIEIEQVNTEEYFYEMRARFNNLIKKGKANTKTAAEIFHYLNRTCFNGLCRFNSNDEFNVPYGRYKKINYQSDFTGYVFPLANWEFSSFGFEQLRLKSKDFVYADPPYDVNFTKYSKTDFTWDDQVRLAEWLSKHKGPVVLSNQATDRIVELYKKMGFSLKFVDAPRRISCNGDRTPAPEVIAYRGL